MTARILIVDDNPTNLKLASSLLELEGHTIIPAIDAEQAQAVLRDTVPDLILMDISLPGMDGLALTRLIKADARLKNVPVIALTAFAMKGDEDKARAAGCAGYITKPIDTRAFPDQIAAFLKHGSGALRLLIADDHPTNLRLLQAQLEAEGHSVLTAANGAEALAILERETVDGVVSDILMPVMDGYRLCLQIRKHARFAGLPFVLYTATYDSPADRELAEAAGADAYIAKPAATATILDALQAASGKRRGNGPAPVPELEAPVLQQYSELLIKKLEEKSLALGQAYEGLAQTEARLSGIVSSSLDAIIAVDAKQNIILFNPAAEAMFGCARSAALGKPLGTFVPPQFRDGHVAQVYAFGAEPGQSRRMGLRVVNALRSDGTQFPIEAAISKLDSSRGRTYTVFIRDITKRRESELALQAAERKYRSIFENSVEGIVQTTLTGQALSGNPAAARLLGYRSAAEAIADIQDIAAQFYVDPDARQAMAAQLLAGQAVHGLETRIRRKDGSIFWASVSASIETDPVTGVRTILAILQDIDERKTQEDKIRRLSRVSAVLSNINALIVRAPDHEALFREACRIAVELGGFRAVWLGLVDPVAKVVRHVARAGVQVSHLPVPDIPVGPGIGESIVATAIRDRAPQIVDDAANDTRIRFREDLLAARIRSIGVFPLVVGGEGAGVITLLAEENGAFDTGEIKLLNEVAEDISFAIDHLRKAERIQYLAQYDALTELPNRALFLERLAHALQIGAGQDEGLAVVIMDLERFRHVNDSLGRTAGDAILQQVAARLRLAVVSAAHIAGDVFAFSIGETRSVADLTRALDEIERRCFGDTYEVGGESLRIGSTAGVAVFPGDGETAEKLLLNAEAALRRAKATREHRLFYSSDINARAAEAMTLENKLRRAIEREEFVLHYQPKVDFASRRICGLEALIRWQDPDRGLVPPGLFIPVLEEAGLIGAVGEWALRQALADQRRWKNTGLTPPRVAVNVSPLQMRRPEFAEMVERIVASVAGAELELEITESLIMDDVERNIGALRRMRATGITVAIDDFGTGYCSLSYVARLPVTSLKIDRSFVVGMMEGPEGLAIVSSIIALAHSLRLKVVAEGIETEEQAGLLRLLSCDEGQGYLFSRPVPFAALEELLRSGGALPPQKPAAT